MRLTRPACRAENGMVASAHYLASTAALDILKRGGTATDAAICAASVLGVVQPHMIGLGGDAFWLIYEAKTRTVHAINGSGPCGSAISLADYAGMASIPQRGPRAAITVPGAVDSWRLAHERFGRLPMADLLATAVDLARRGMPISDDLAGWIAEDRDALAADPGAASLFLDDGCAPKAGARLRQAALAETLELIADAGPRAFYERTGRSIADYLASRGGKLAHADFLDYRARFVAPITTEYRGYTAYQLPPPSQGIAGLLILNFLQGIDLARLQNNTGAYFHALIQATKWAFEKRDRHLADPNFVDVPLADLLDPARCDAERKGWLDGPVQMTATAPTGSDTTFIATADAEGNAVGTVQSLYFDFGACVADPISGIMMQNRGSAFSLDHNHQNALAPGKQSASTLMSGMLMKDGLAYAVYGSQGGEVQPQAQTAFITRLVDHGLDVQAALEAPRLLYGRSWGDDANKLWLEQTAPDVVFATLRGRGHPVEPVGWPHTRMGTAQAIRLKGPWSGFLEGGADPRGEGIAVGY